MSASTLVTTTFTNSTDANFRAWGLAFHNAIIAGGWVDNGDSGQIDFATVTAPAAINTSQGYKIYRSNDAGGSLVDFYVKLEFGSGGTSALRPAVWITAGFQGTNGAGTLLSTINPISTRTQLTTGATPAGLSISINMAAGSGYICIVGTANAASPAENLYISVERTRNTSLAFKNEVLLIGSGVGSVDINSGINQCVNTLNVYPAVSTAGGNTNVFAYPLAANSPVAGVVGVGLVFGLAPGPTSPSLNLLGVEADALGLYQDVVSITILGTAHNYKVQRNNLFGSMPTSNFMSRFE